MRLAVGSTLPILGAILIAPVLPQLQAAFRGTPGVEVLAPVALSIPSLAVGLLAIVAGRIVDRVGRLRLLLGALPLYVVAGTAPLWLDSLPAIVASRALIGVAEAAIMTCCVTLIGDYWQGERRERYLSLQVVVTSGSAVLFLLAGGALGAIGWRTPFWAYLCGLLFLPLALRFLWQPARPRTAAAESGGSVRAVPWRALAPLLALTLAGAVVFYALQLELSFVLDGLGVGAAGIRAVRGPGQPRGDDRSRRLRPPRPRPRARGDRRRLRAGRGRPGRHRERGHARRGSPRARWSPAWAARCCWPRCSSAPPPGCPTSAAARARGRGPRRSSKASSPARCWSRACPRPRAR
jgi:hypothetical protein